MAFTVIKACSLSLCYYVSFHGLCFNLMVIWAGGSDMCVIFHTSSATDHPPTCSLWTWQPPGSVQYVDLHTNNLQLTEIKKLLDHIFFAINVSSLPRSSVPALSSAATLSLTALWKHNNSSDLDCNQDLIHLRRRSVTTATVLYSCWTVRNTSLFFLPSAIRGAACNSPSKTLWEGNIYISG